MASDDPIRASDTDREAVVAVLRDAYTEGRLTLDEFDERVTDAYAGRTWGDLRMLTADLPVKPVLGADLPGRPEPAGPAQPPQPQRALPAYSPRHAMPQEQRRRRSTGLLVPVAIWVLIALNGSAANGLVAVLVIVFVAAVFAAAANRR